MKTLRGRKEACMAPWDRRGTCHLQAKATLPGRPINNKLMSGQGCRGSHRDREGTPRVPLQFNTGHPPAAPAGLELLPPLISNMAADATLAEGMVVYGQLDKAP